MVDCPLKKHTKKQKVFFYYTPGHYIGAGNYIREEFWYSPPESGNKGEKIRTLQKH